MACCNTQIHVNDVNVVFNGSIEEDCVVVDISAATNLQFIFKKPDGSSLTKTAVFTTDGTDGAINYSTIAGDLSEAGVWSIQAVVTIGNSVYHSSIKTFKVYNNL